jgi:hypothetical protein
MTWQQLVIFSSGICGIFDKSFEHVNVQFSSRMIAGALQILRLRLYVTIQLHIYIHGRAASLGGCIYMRRFQHIL